MRMEMLLGFGMGIIILSLVVGIVFYVLTSLGHMKALQVLGYDKAWLAWIPFGVYFGCADAVCGNDEKVMLFGKFEIPAIIFKLWWIIPIVIFFLPVEGILLSLLSLLDTVVRVVFLGYTYTKMYARIDGKTEHDSQVLGLLSGFIPLIAAVKFLTIKK